MAWQAAPAGFSLLELGIEDFDPGFGGRWNAGANKRGGGSSLSNQEYVDNLLPLIDQRIKTLSL